MTTRGRFTTILVLALGLSLVVPAVASARPGPGGKVYKRNKQHHRGGRDHGPRHNGPRYRGPRDHGPRHRGPHYRGPRQHAQHHRVRPRLRRRWHPPVVRPYVAVRPRRQVHWPRRRMVLVPPPVIVIEEPGVIIEDHPAQPRARQYQQPQQQPKYKKPQRRSEPESPQPPDSYDERLPEQQEPPAEYDEPAPAEQRPEPERQQPTIEAQRSRAGQTLTEEQAVALEDQILQLINVERRKANLAPLEAQNHLINAAVGHSTEMFTLGYFSHSSPTSDRKKFTDRMSIAGVTRYGAAGENIAMTSAPDGVAARFVKMWMDSPGHRRNILDPRFKISGLGVFGDGSVIYATQVFADAVETADDGKGDKT